MKDFKPPRGYVPTEADPLLKQPAIDDFYWQDEYSPCEGHSWTLNFKFRGIPAFICGDVYTNPHWCEGFPICDNLSIEDWGFDIIREEEYHDYEHLLSEDEKELSDFLEINERGILKIVNTVSVLGYQITDNISQEFVVSCLQSVPIEPLQYWEDPTSKKV